VTGAAVGGMAVAAAADARVTGRSVSEALWIAGLHTNFWSPLKTRIRIVGPAGELFFGPAP
jgi:hypothetical protein